MTAMDLLKLRLEQLRAREIRLRTCPAPRHSSERKALECGVRVAHDRVVNAAYKLISLGPDHVFEKD